MFCKNVYVWYPVSPRSSYGTLREAWLSTSNKDTKSINLAMKEWPSDSLSQLEKVIFHPKQVITCLYILHFFENCHRWYVQVLSLCIYTAQARWILAPTLLWPKTVCMKIFISISSFLTLNTCSRRETVILTCLFLYTGLCWAVKEKVSERFKQIFCPFFHNLTLSSTVHTLL